jgi:hypothetical protein
MTEFHVTRVECKCGCGVLLNSALVERGWRYLRGHKPAGLPKVNPPAKVGASEHVSYERTLAMAQQNLAECRRTRERLVAEREAMKQRIEQIERDEQRLEELCRALGAMTGGTRPLVQLTEGAVAHA